MSGGKLAGILSRRDLVFAGSEASGQVSQFINSPCPIGDGSGRDFLEPG